MSAKLAACTFFILAVCGTAVAQDIQGPINRFRMAELIRQSQEAEIARERKRSTRPRIIRADPYSPASASDLASRAVALFPKLDLSSVYLANHLKAMGLKDAGKYGIIFWLKNQDGKAAMFINADGDLDKDNAFLALEQELRKGNDDAVAVVGGWIAAALEYYSPIVEYTFLVDYRTARLAQGKQASELLEEAIERAQKEANKEKKAQEKDKAEQAKRAKKSPNPDR